MIRIGDPPYLECSSKGDKRFSAYFARLKSHNNSSVEEVYQAAKVFKIPEDPFTEIPDECFETGRPRIDLSCIPQPSSWQLKDIQKFKVCNKLIAWGSINSSSRKYAELLPADQVNCEQYDRFDVVGISIEGKRHNRVNPPLHLIQKAALAPVIFISDCWYDRSRAYNVGERALAKLLQTMDYIEQPPGGRWFPTYVTETGYTPKEAKACNYTLMNYAYLGKLYYQLWKQYLAENPYLYQVLTNASGLSDIFGQKGHMCQAITLWQLRNECLETNREKDNENQVAPL